MEEIWKDIIGYEDLYQISNTGRVVNKKDGREKSIFKSKCGSLYVGLNKKSKTNTIKIDRLLYDNFGIEYEDNYNLENELWVDIDNFVGRYKVSNKGRVKSLDRYISQIDSDGNEYLRFMKGKILSLNRTNGNGYINFQLSDGFDNQPNNNSYIHILVANAFIPNPENKDTVNHIDGNKKNNCVENLEWATPKEQAEHAIRTGLIKRKSIRKLNYIKAEEIREKYKTGNYTYNDLAKEYNCGKNSIYSVIKNKSFIKL